MRRRTSTRTSSKAWVVVKDTAYGDLPKIHVAPVRDLRDHLLQGRGCWCRPRCTVERNPLGTATGVVVAHNSEDGRELIERFGLN